MEKEILTCPFCDFTHHDDYQLMYHVEIHHSESGTTSPFAITDALAGPESHQVPPEVTPRNNVILSPTSTTEIKYVDCPHKCGERLPVEELNSHTDFHMAEDMAIEEVNKSSHGEPDCPIDSIHGSESVAQTNFTTNIATSLRNHGSLSLTTSSNAKGHLRVPSLKELFFGSSGKDRKPPKSSSIQNGTIQRLGKAELGPYAHEKRMPSWLYKMLEEGAKVTVSNKLGPDGRLTRVEVIANETPNLIHVLARLSAMDKAIARAYYCNPEVRHLAKMRNEGGFCGYRNIQMLISYIRDSKATGCESFKSKIPTILTLQDMIEHAWDMGYNEAARIETGGIKHTRKYIGTPEAQALFQSLDIPCEAVAFASQEKSEAYISLLQAIIEHFEGTEESSSKVLVSEKPPIYFQHKGHSMTIVGVEVQHNGTASLVVFDPMFNPSASIKKLTNSDNFRVSDPAKLMKAYRRGEAYLSKYKDFEILKLTARMSKPERETSYDVVDSRSGTNSPNK